MPRTGEFSAMAAMANDQDQFAESHTTLWTLILMFRQLKVVLEGRGLKHQFVAFIGQGFSFNSEA